MNGSGKSSLLKIFAGVDKDFIGETHLSPGYTIGYLEQEPLLDCNKTVKEVVQEGAQEAVDLLKEFEELSNRFAEPMSDEEMNELIEKQGKIQDRIDQLDAWDIDSRLM